MAGITLCLLLTTFWLGLVQADDEFPIVNINQGAVKGQKVNSTSGLTYYSFQGIPYAKPPVGDLRFKAPEAPEPWKGTLEALKAGNVCTQRSSYFRAIIGDEDCLFLNILTPQWPSSENLLPVMVWIHGGGYSIGSGDASVYNPEFLLNEGVMYVSINYRLGVLGFISTEDEAIPGNAGLKDQVMALRWIQQNIAAFGGDPAKVTIFGESAGSVAVSLHFLSPMSAGLFRAAIAQSGSAGSTFHFRYSPRKDAFFFGNIVGYSGNSSQELVDFLRTMSAEDLIQSQSVLPEEDQYRLSPVIYGPSVETEVEGEETFFSEDPVNLLAEGKFHNVPFITGTCSSEGITFIQAVLTGTRTPKEIDEDFTKTFKPDLRFCRESPCGDEMTAKIKNFYFGDQPISNSTLENLVDLVTDILFAEGTVYAADKISSKNSEPVFFYEFAYDGGLGVSKKLTPGASNLSGTAHADDLAYIFRISLAEPTNSTDVEVRSEMVTMWTNFAKTLNPTPEGTNNIPTWLPYSSHSTNYLDIDWQLAVKTDFRKARMDFWKNLYASPSLS